jgi:hypothetical protein
MTDVYEAISQVSELEERVHEELTVYLYLCPKDSLFDTSWTYNCNII